MKKKIRLFLLALALLVFMFIAPLTVYYAMGYRLPELSGRTSAISVLIIETNPRRARVDINDRLSGRSPLAVTNLVPKQVDVSISMAGYQSWKKNLALKPYTVTEIRDVRLFPEQPQITAILESVNNFSLSPNRNILAAVTNDGQLHILDDEGVAIFAPLSFTAQLKDLLWSPDSSSFLAVGGNATWLVDLAGRNIAAKKLSAFWREYTWDPRVTGRLLVVDEQKDLLALRPRSGETTKIASHIKSFAVSSRRIYAVDMDNRLHILSPQGVLLDTLNFIDDRNIQRIMVTPGDQVALEFVAGELSVLSAERQIVDVASGVRKYGWSPDGQLLFFQTDDTTLHIFNAYDERLSYLPPLQQQMIVRLSRPIRDAQWYAGGRHLIYQVDDEIVITEIDTRDYPASFVVDSTNLGSSSPTVGVKGDSVFYLKETGTSIDLMKASLVME